MIGNKEVVNISIEDIIPNRFQPRLSFDEKALNELADSIRQHGVLQPLLVRRIGNKYEIIAGERRYKASCIAGLYNVPAIVVETDDNTSAEIAITENIQRKDLSAIEEAQSYRKLLEKGQTQDEVAKKLGIGQSTVANKVRLLALTDEAQDALLRNKISERHARGLLRITDAQEQIKLLNRIINDKLTVKQTEDEIALMLSSSNNGEPEVFTPTFNFESAKEEVFVPSKPYSDKEEIFEIPDFDEPKPELAPAFEEDKIESEIDSSNKILSPFELPKKELELENPALLRFDEPEILNPFLNEFKDQKPEELDFFEEIKPIEKNYLDVVNKTRGFVRGLESEGQKISTEEFDFEDVYQIVIKINKNE